MSSDTKAMQVVCGVFVRAYEHEIKDAMTDWPETQLRHPRRLFLSKINRESEVYQGFARVTFRMNNHNKHPFCVSIKIYLDGTKEVHSVDGMISHFKDSFYQKMMEIISQHL